MSAAPNIPRKRSQGNDGGYPQQPAAAAAAHDDSAALKYAFREQEKQRLTNNSKERAQFDNLADLYSVIVATEHLETAYVRDAVDAESYTKACSKLIAQFKVCRETVSSYCPDIEQFMRDHRMQCAAAVTRLLRAGVPATVEHGGAADAPATEKEDRLVVFHAVQAFITTMDQLKLDMRAVDELHPNLSDLMTALNKVPNLPPDHESRSKVKAWLVTLNSMRAHEELSPDQARQMSFDLEQGYQALELFFK